MHEHITYKPKLTVSYYLSITLVFIAFLFSACHNKKTAEAPQNLYNHTDANFNLVLNKAEKICDSGFVERSTHFLDSAYRELDPDNIADQLNYLNFYFIANYRDKRDYAMANFYADSIIAIIHNNKLEKKLPEKLVAAYFSKGDALLGLHKYADAFYYYFHAKIISTDNLNPCDQDDFTYHLAMVLYRQERYAEALDNFKQSYTQGINCGHEFNDFYRRQEVLDNIGLCYLNTMKYDSALLYFQKCLDYINTNETNFKDKPTNLFVQARAVIYGNMAGACMALEQYKKAEDLLKSSIAINAMPGNDQLDAQLSRLKLSGLYFKTHNLSGIPPILSTVAKVLDSLPDNKVRRDYYRQMWQYYDAGNNIPQAYFYQTSYIKLTDTLKQQLHSLLEMDMSEHLKTLEKENQINILEKEDALKRNYLIIALVSSILSLIIIYLLFENWRKSNKNVRALEGLNNKIADQNKAQEKLLKELEKSNNEKDRILRAVAHDIRNPLTAIAALNKMLRESLTDTFEDNKEILDLIKNAIDDTLTLSEDILQASSHAQMELLDKEPTNIQKLVQNNVNLLRFKANEKKQKLNLHLPEEPLIIQLNREKISRVLGNLISNAIKFSFEESTINIYVTKTQHGVLFQVSDSGVGIPNNLKYKVFDMFTEAKRLGTSGEKPFGLGLSIARQIIELHGGEIWFESVPDKGTVFSFSVPDVEQ